MIRLFSSHFSELPPLELLAANFLSAISFVLKLISSRLYHPELVLRMSMMLSRLKHPAMRASGHSSGMQPMKVSSLEWLLGQLL